MKKWWLYLFFILALVSVASAQYYYTDRGLGGFGIGDIVDFYFDYPYWFDFFISLIIFISLGKTIFGGDAYRRGGTGLTVGMALALSFALVIWESRTGFNLGKIWWFALLVLILAVIGAVYNRYFKGAGFSLKPIAIGIFLLTIAAWYFFGDYFYKIPDFFINIFYFLMIISGIYVFVLLIGWVLGMTGGGLPAEPSERDYLARGGRGVGRGLWRGVRGASRALHRRLRSRESKLRARYNRLIEQTRARYAKDPRKRDIVVRRLRDRFLGELNRLKGRTAIQVQQVQRQRTEVSTRAGRVGLERRVGIKNLQRQLVQLRREKQAGVRRADQLHAEATRLGWTEHGLKPRRGETSEQMKERERRGRERYKAWYRQFNRNIQIEKEVREILARLKYLRRKLGR